VAQVVLLPRGVLMRTLVGVLLDPDTGFPSPRKLATLTRAAWAQQLLEQGVPPDAQLLAVPLALGAWLRCGRRVVHLGDEVAAQLAQAPLPTQLPPPQQLAAELVLHTPAVSDEPLVQRFSDGTTQEVQVLVAGWLLWHDEDAGWSALPHLLSVLPGHGPEPTAHAAAPLALDQLLADVLTAPGTRPDLQLLLAALVALCDERVAELRPLPRAAHRSQRRRLQRAARQPTRWERLMLAPTADSVWRVGRLQAPQARPGDQGSPAPAQAPAAAPGPPRAPAAPHSVREHDAVVWVAQPRPGEQVLDTRTRTLGELVVDGQVVGTRTRTLHAVRRPRAGHVRGSGAPRPRHQLLDPAG
jgi:hypothetical protein